jgi:hypothetical protein
MARSRNLLIEKNLRIFPSLPHSLLRRAIQYAAIELAESAPSNALLSAGILDVEIFNVYLTRKLEACILTEAA